jgi:hypothetical protein
VTTLRLNIPLIPLIALLSSPHGFSTSFRSRFHKPTQLFVPPPSPFSSSSFPEDSCRSSSLRLVQPGYIFASAHVRDGQRLRSTKHRFRNSWGIPKSSQRSVQETWPAECPPSVSCLPFYLLHRESWDEKNDPSNICISFGGATPAH